MASRMLSRLRAAARDDSGVGIIVVLLVVVVAAALGTTVAVAGVSGLRNANRDRASASAQATSDAGVAEAISYIRSHSIGAMKCAEPLNPSGTSWETATGCTTPGWSDPLSPEIVSGGATHVGGSCQTGANCWEVWIGTLQTYSPASENSTGTGLNAAQQAVFRIHSLAFSGIGPAGRSVVVDVAASPASFPIGVFGNTVTEHSAASYVQAESVFTAGGITVKCGLSGWDPQYNIPAAIHAAGTISYQGNCGPGSGDPTTACNTRSGVPTDPYDQDGNGIAFPTTSPCYEYDAHDPNFAGYTITNPYPTTSLFSAQNLASYGYQPGGLSASEYAQLQAIAQAEGTYDNEPNLSSVLSSLVSEGVTSPVIYDDNGTTPSLSDFPSAFFRSAIASGGACPNPYYSLTIIVRNASMLWSGSPSSPLVASIFVPDAGTQFKETGQVQIIGTLFAYSIDMEGNTQPAFQLDQCFVDNPPSGVLDTHILNYHSIDNGNLQ